MKIKETSPINFFDRACKLSSAPEIIALRSNLGINKCALATAQRAGELAIVARVCADMRVDPLQHHINGRKFRKIFLGIHTHKSRGKQLLRDFYLAVPADLKTKEISLAPMERKAFCFTFQLMIMISKESSSRRNRKSLSEGLLWRSRQREYRLFEKLPLRF